MPDAPVDDRPTEPSASDTSDALNTARSVLVDALGGLDDTEEARLRDGDAAYAARRLQALNEEKTWMTTVGVTMTVFAIVLPTAGLYQFFRAVDSLQPIELIGIIAATCLAAVLLMIPPVRVYTGWRRRRLCYEALAALGRPAPSDDVSRDAPEAAPDDA